MPPIDDIKRHIDRGEYKDAEATARTTLGTTNPLKDPTTGDLLDLLVEAMWRGGKATWPKTLAKAEFAIENRKVHSSSTSPQQTTADQKARSLTNLAIVLYEKGHEHYAEATRLLACAKKILGGNNPSPPISIERGWVLTYYAMLLHETGGNATVILNYQREAEGIFSSWSPLTAQGWFQRGMVGGGLVKHSRAVIAHAKGETTAKLLYKTALTAREGLEPKGPPPSHPDVAGTMNNLGTLYHDEADYTHARKCYDDALAIRIHLGDHHPHLADTRSNLSLLGADESRGL